jgi:hypothetical protein
VDHSVGPLIANEGDVFRAEGGPETWNFRVQFRDRAALQSFRDDCKAEGVPFELLRLYNPHAPGCDNILTEAQHQVIVAAYEGGYWNVPRGVTITELAKRFEISVQAVSERLRRATNTLVEPYIASEMD